MNEIKGFLRLLKLVFVHACLLPIDISIMCEGLNMILGFIGINKFCGFSDFILLLSWVCKIV